MCAAVLGQCGPRVPRFKSLFHSLRYSDEFSFLRGSERHAELQSIWQEIGEDKNQKLDELRQLISAAVDRIYERALEESIRRKMTLEEVVLQSEIRLKEFLGTTSLQVIASKELPLQSRLNMNMARLQDLDNARVGGYGWVGGLVLLVEVRHRIAALRQLLKLPACDGSADLDEVLSSTTEALQNLYPGRTISIPPLVATKSEQKPIVQRLQRFYQTLCALESFWVETLASKDADRKFGFLECPDDFSKLQMQGMEHNKDTRKRNLDLLLDDKDITTLTNTLHSFGCNTIKRSSSRFSYRSKENKAAKQCSEEASALEQLSQKILRKLEDINRQVKCPQPNNETFSSLSSCLQSSDIECSPASSTTEVSGSSKGFCTPMLSASMSPSSEDNGADTPTSVLPVSKAIKRSTSSFHLSRGISTLWAECNLVEDKICEDPKAAALDACWAALAASEGKEEKILDRTPSNEKIQKNDTVTISDLDNRSNEAPSDRWPLLPITNNQRSPVLTMKVQAPSLGPSPYPTPPPASTATLPPPPPPPPPPLPPPPPPPRSYSALGKKAAEADRSAKLKRSTTISRLYMGMKKRVEGAVPVRPTSSSDVAVPRRSVVGAGTRDTMAEALAEITRRSSFFRKIEDDVQKHAGCILEVKSRLESFESHNMEHLLCFHESIEAQLEQLTDESQVLARFEDFPIKKLETMRAAASLYLRLTSLIQQIESWRVEPPMAEQLEKVTAFFEKVKTDIETIERTKEDDIQRFRSYNIHFSFDIIARIKEAVVGLSSRCLALTLKDSQRTKAVITQLDAECISGKDMNKLRVSFQMLWKAFQLAFRVHNFAGGHDDKAEQLSSDLANEMDSYPSSFWMELVSK